jgi:7-cyano-7-deazaguanine synthase
MGALAVVVLSGGQDSVTCLYWAKARFAEVYAVSFDYGQRHKRELAAAEQIAREARVPHRILDLPALFQLKGGALTDESIAVAAGGGFQGLPTTFVPMRNAAFLTLAAAWAVQLCEGKRKLGQTWDPHLVTGVCQTDYSGYPDCRREFVDAMEKALSLACDRKIQIQAPLMGLTKRQTVELANEMPGCLRALRLSITCYHGQRPGCGTCPACELRAKGFREAGIDDPAEDDVTL